MAGLVDLMQTTQKVSIEQLHQVVEAIFDQGEVSVKQAYSDFERPTLEFTNADALKKDMAYQPGQKDALFLYSIYYPGTRGHVFEQRIELKPESCNGYKFRFRQVGWGLIQFQCNFKTFPVIECRIAVNSEARSGNWSQTFPELKDPNLWDWEVLNKKAGRLIRLLRKSAT
jgi:hypothetical protein